MKPAAQTPAAMKLAQETQLGLKQPATWIMATIMVTEDHGRGQSDLLDVLDQPEISFTEIANKQQGIGLQLLDQVPITVRPGSMEISSDGKTKNRQN